MYSIMEIQLLSVSFRNVKRHVTAQTKSTLTNQTNIKKDFLQYVIFTDSWTGLYNLQHQ